MESNNSRFGKVLSEMMNTYKKKNADYGNSFSETIQEFGYIPAIARINDKIKRVKNMVKGQPMNIKESMRDNLVDIANYCVLTIMEIDKNENKANESDFTNLLCKHTTNINKTQ